MKVYEYVIKLVSNAVKSPMRICMQSAVSFDYPQMDGSIVDNSPN